MKYLAILGLALVAQFGMAQQVHIIGDSLHDERRTAVDGVPQPSHLLRFFGMDVTCDCISGMSLLDAGARAFKNIDAPIVVFALQTNDAGISYMTGKSDSWLQVYLFYVDVYIRQLVAQGKRVIFILPSVVGDANWYDPATSHLFRWFSYGVAINAGAEVLDIEKANVPLGPDGIHYGNEGTLAYAIALANQINGIPPQ